MKEVNRVCFLGLALVNLVLYNDLEDLQNTTRGHCAAYSSC